jgi:glycosyltransferase involved in cell wall biosynthesis
MEIPLKILISGDNGASLPPPYSGIMKHCLLYARQWKDMGASVYMHIHNRHGEEDDMGAKATYFYDFESEPNILTKLSFLAVNFFSHPALFFSALRLQLKLNPEHDWSLMLYCAGRAVVLNDAITRFSPNVIVTETGGLQSLISLHVGKYRNVPVVLENYAEILFKGKAEKENEAPRYAELWEYLVNNVDLVVSSSAHCAKGPEMYSKNTSKIRVIYSGINFKVFDGNMLHDKEKARIKFALPKDKYLVMAVGALRMRKGHDHLFESLLLLSSEEREKIVVVLCGMGDIAELRTRAKEAGFPDESLKIFQGLSESDLAELYSAVDCFCFPSVTPRECMGLALKEAMAIGLPVAAYDSGGIKEAIEDGVNGKLVPTGDKQALSDALRYLMEMHPEEKKQMRLKNIQKAGKLFDLNITSQRLLDELERLTL